MTRVLAALAALTTAACVASGVGPAAVRLNEDACAHCRMTIVSTKTAAQVVAPGGEPVFFDDLACLRQYLDAHPLPEGAAAFVADYDTGAWIDVRAAAIVKSPYSTPMGSGLIAHPREKGGMP